MKQQNSLQKPLKRLKVPLHIRFILFLAKHLVPLIIDPKEFEKPADKK